MTVSAFWSPTGGRVRTAHADASVTARPNRNLLITHLLCKRAVTGSPRSHGEKTRCVGAEGDRVRESRARGPSVGNDALVLPEAGHDPNLGHGAQ